MAANTTCESLITKDIAIACQDIVTKGLESDGVIINRADIDFSATVFDDTNPLIIKQLVLKTGKKAYSIVQLGSKPFTGTKSDLNVGTYNNKWDTELPIMVLGNTPDVVNGIVEGLANGTFVCILRNVTKGQDGKGEYQIFGYAQGLRASAGTREPWSDTEGGYLMTLKEEGAPHAAYFYFNTDSSTTAKAYEALKSTAA